MPLSQAGSEEGYRTLHQIRRPVLLVTDLVSAVICMERNELVQSGADILFVGIQLGPFATTDDRINVSARRGIDEPTPFMSVDR